MNALTNQTGLSLSAAVWLAYDPYDNGADQFPDATVISATTLLKPIRQTVLRERLPLQEQVEDISTKVASVFGRAIHDSKEKAWIEGYAQAMQRLGYPKGMIEKIRINPETVEPDTIPVWLEQRGFREITVDGWKFIISGQADEIIDGELGDTKTTSVYSWINRSKDDDYQKQGSVYRWIFPEKITSDVMYIQHVFTDWQSFKARVEPGYPQNRLIEHKVELMPLAETDRWIRGRLRELIANANLPEPELVRCTDKELWRSDPQFKYYADPAKASSGGRSTKNFPNFPAAAAWKNSQGKGVIVTVPGKVKACSYCAAFSICGQQKEYDHGD